MSGSNRLAGLKARPKDTTAAEVRRVDEVGEARGSLIEPHARNRGVNQALAPISCIRKSSLKSGKRLPLRQSALASRRDS